jgi:hypothetical protein
MIYLDVLSKIINLLCKNYGDEHALRCNLVGDVEMKVCYQKCTPHR